MPDPLARSMFDGLTDLLLLVRRDGTVLGHVGGRGIGALLPSPEAVGQNLQSLWPEAAARSVRQCMLQALARRSVMDATVIHGEQAYDLRVCPQGPDRALCIIRMPSSSGGDPSVGAWLPPSQGDDRRAFVRRLEESLGAAALRERPAAVAAIRIEGLRDLPTLMASPGPEDALTVALRRLEQSADIEVRSALSWFVGPVSEDLLVMVLESRDRDRIEDCVSRVCDSLKAPLTLGAAPVHLTPYAGVAILGIDGASARLLLRYACASAAEAQRSGIPGICFFSDTARMRSPARIDAIRELHDAVDGGQVRLRYWARRDLASGALVAAVGYIRWQHPLRGEVRPAEFLAVAESTGLAVTLSRSVMHSLAADCRVLRAQGGSAFRLSFGPLRQHILHDGFFEDVVRLIEDGPLPAERLELRINERSLIACDPGLLQRLARLGVHLIVDELGRGIGSFDVLAAAPLVGVQLDRKWVRQLPEDGAALKVCRAGIGVAAGLGLKTIVRGVERAEQHAALLALGVDQGIGDYYGTLDAAPTRSAVRASARSSAVKASADTAGLIKKP